jgi:zinc-binding alcohol dehydrogenase family protein
MKAVGLYKYLPIENDESLMDLEIPKPEAVGRDLLVRVKAVSVNPVDTKIRAPKEKLEKKPKILGWDAAGVIENIGPEVSLFKTGQEVYYAGSILRQGSNAEYQLVDERIVGHKPKSLSFEEAAALPLTTITAWEAMFEQMNISADEKEINAGKSILIIGASGGVGSITIQLAKKLAGLTVIASASRNETSEWCKKLGADYIINHRNSIKEELEKIKLKEVDYIFCLHSTATHFPATAELIKPFGKFCSIVAINNGESLDINLLRSRSGTFSWEFMFTRSSYQTHDMQSQHDLLNITADLVDKGILKTTMTENMGMLNAENLKKAHAKIESGKTIGKIVLSQIE